MTPDGATVAVSSKLSQRGGAVISHVSAARPMPTPRRVQGTYYPSKQRATVLSFDSLLGSTGGVALQPGLGRLADASGYPPTFVVSAVFQACAIPLLALARRERATTDLVARTEPAGPVTP